jgi:tellurite resistance protein
MINHHSALIYTMLLVSASDRRMTDAELAKMGNVVKTLPIFAGYDPDDLPRTAQECARIINSDDGVDTLIQIIRDALPGALRETGYALACDVIAADPQASREEIKTLEFLRRRLGIDGLVAKALERGARARHARL